MKFLGKPGEIEKPKITANGTPISGAIIDNQVGAIPMCSFSLPPELVGPFMEYKKKVELKVESKTAQGVIFKGVTSGCSFSNTTGRVSCRVDLVHELCKELDSASMLFPGHMPGSASDAEAYIKVPSSGSNSMLSPKTVIPVNTDGEFWNSVKKAIDTYSKTSASRSGAGLTKPEGIGEVLKALDKVKSETGKIVGGNIFSAPIGEMLSNVVKSSDVSATFWNTLSIFLSELDLTFIAKPDGTVIVAPNYSGMSSGGANKIETEYVISFDQSSRFDRTPKEILILCSDLQYSQSANYKHKCVQIGRHVSDGFEWASGTFSVEAPRFMRHVSFIEAFKQINSSLFNSYAELISSRELASMLTCNITTPLCLGAYPGTCAEFKHLSKIKTFDGKKINEFDKQFDGYCWKITHELGSASVPVTTFSFKSVSMDGKPNKPQKHPFWPGGKMLKWS